LKHQVQGRADNLIYRIRTVPLTYGETSSACLRLGWGWCCYCYRADK